MDWCAHRDDLPYFETSAKNSINVEQAFKAVAHSALAAELAVSASSNSITLDPQNRDSLSLERNDLTTPQSRRRCCWIRFTITGFPLLLDWTSATTPYGLTFSVGLTDPVQIVVRCSNHQALSPMQRAITFVVNQQASDGETQKTGDYLHITRWSGLHPRRS